MWGFGVWHDHLEGCVYACYECAPPLLFSPGVGQLQAPKSKMSQFEELFGPIILRKSKISQFDELFGPIILRKKVVASTHIYTPVSRTLLPPPLLHNLTHSLTHSLTHPPPQAPKLPPHSLIQHPLLRGRVVGGHSMRGAARGPEPIHQQRGRGLRPSHARFMIGYWFRLFITCPFHDWLLVSVIDHILVS